MSENGWKVVLDDLGYYRLDPIPQVADYYRNGYHESSGLNRAPDLRRAIDSGPEYEHEKSWLFATLWEDIREIGILCLQQWIKGYHFLDFGCGVGDLCSYMQDFGWVADGVEVSTYARGIARKKKLTIYNKLAECGKYDLISAINVLEHLPNPKDAILELKSHLADGGVLVIQVPNDFSPLQQIVKTKIGGDNYWVAYPDHINYFNFASLKRLLEHCGMQVVYRMATFPMEWFVLLGNNYVQNRELGTICHDKRVQFDLSLPTDTRREFYTKLAEIGWGRHCIVFATSQEPVRLHTPFDWAVNASPIPRV